MQHGRDVANTALQGVVWKVSKHSMFSYSSSFSSSQSNISLLRHQICGSALTELQAGLQIAGNMWRVQAS
jgi:hypothetical protein